MGNSGETFLGLIVAAEVTLLLAGLLLAERLFEGVQVESGPRWQQLLLLTVVAVLFSYVNPDFNLPGLTTLFLVALGALKLWLLSWLSTWMDLTLQISGFWTFVGTACLLVVLTGPIRLIERLTRRPEPEEGPFWYFPPKPPMLLDL